MPKPQRVIDRAKCSSLIKGFDKEQDTVRTIQTVKDTPADSTAEAQIK
jgi:hypothetical protein